MISQKEKHTERLMLRLNPSLMAKLKQHVETNDIKVSQLVRKSLNNYLS